jgi:ribosomal protein S27AE
MLVEHSDASRSTVKARLYEEGVKARRCESCGQDETWLGRRMALILDHINGVSDDNRLSNLRILCPNCAATLDTHCGRRLRQERAERACPECGIAFRPSRAQQRYCGRACGTSAGGRASRRVERPPLDALRAEVERDGFLAVGRRLGVSDNAMRKWFRGAGQEPPRRLPAAAGSAGAGGDGSPD